MRKAVVVVIRNSKNEILLLKRGNDHPMFPGEWCFPGGKLDWYREQVKLKLDPKADAWTLHTTIQQETYEQCAVREVREETGIQLITFLDMGMWLADEEFIVKVFHSETAELLLSREFPNREHVEARWVSEDNFPNGIGKMTKQQLIIEWDLESAFLEDLEHEA